MSADRLGGSLRRWFLAVRRSFAGVLDGGTPVSAVVEPFCGTESLGALRLQLTVWEQRL